MTVHNSDIIACFSELADLLEIEGANPFRVRAYRNATYSIASLHEQIVDILKKGEDLRDIPGIGEDLAKKIKEIVKTKTCLLLERTRNKINRGLVQLLKIEGLGPKRVRLLHDILKISSLEDLVRAIQDGRLISVRGYGQRSVAKLASAVRRITQESTRFLRPHAEEIAEALLRYLKSSKYIHQLALAGSYRRQKETVGDLDFVASSLHPRRVLNHFCCYEDIKEVLSRGTTRASIRLQSGIRVDFRVVAPKSYGAALYYFTGSKNHNIVLRRIAQKQGLKVNEYGIFRGVTQIAGRTEESIFRILGLDYIEPELREQRGEIEAATTHTLPHLVNIEDIKGDLHVHTDATDGENSLAEMADKAGRLGYEYIAITDHSQRVSVAHGLSPQGVYRQLKKIEKLNSTMRGFTILTGIEVDILEDGSLDLPDTVLMELDIVVCSVHYHLNLPFEKQTDRFLRAIDNPYCKILGHLTGRLLGRRAACEFDVERVLQKAAKKGCFVEINAQPERLDLPDNYYKLGKELGIKFSIASDAHAVSDFRYIRYGIGQARRGWLESLDIINTRTLRDLKKLFRT